MTSKPRRRHAPFRDLAGTVVQFREYAGNPVHERGLTMTRNEWSSVLYLPGLCLDFGAPCPEWASALYWHALVVEEDAPEPVLVALLQAMRYGVAASCGLDGALRGVALDLCVIVPTTGTTAEIVPTAFGFGVALLHRLRQLDEGDGKGEGEGEGEPAPWLS